MNVQYSINKPAGNNGLSNHNGRSYKELVSKGSCSLSNDQLPIMKPLTTEGIKKKKKKKKYQSSKYDFVKVRIWLTDTNHYILSRFLISRFLTSTQIKSSHALSISLELKKRLVDQSQWDYSQSEMERVLFSLMDQYHYGEDYIQLYKMISHFHHERIPLLILISGTGCIGRSLIARRLSERLNLPGVLHMDVIYEMTICPKEPIWHRYYSQETTLVQDYQCEALELRRCITPEIQKCIEEGKSLILEGIHLNREIYETWLRERAKHAMIIPFLLYIEDVHEHETMIKEWMTHEKPTHDEDTTTFLRSYQHFQSIQNYLYEGNKHDDGFHVVHVCNSTQRETIQSMHTRILNEMTHYLG
jgi:2-phosphoglycerate kinase